MTPNGSPPPGVSRRSELTQRVLTGIALSSVSLYVIWLGLYPFVALVVVFALIGLNEFYRFAERKGVRPGRKTGALFTVALIAAALWGGESALNQTLLFGTVASFTVLLLRPHERVSPLLDCATTLLGVLYVGWMFSFLVLLRKFPDGAALITLLIVASAFTDMGGYFVGRKFGRTKLYPRVSPKKTVEGSLGGLIWAVLACLILGWHLGLPLAHCAATAVLVAIAGQFGDLFESSLKRDVGVKDSGQVLAGHGGVLDRFDSLAFAAPMFYLYAVLIML